MVQTSHNCRASRYPQEDDRGTGPQVAGCLMEVCHVTDDEVPEGVILNPATCF